ncbi:Uncharacterised protein [uncultured Clostridium sp.]|nr:Uncharacterised protein [uncultured Clostridium sp.]
MYKKSVFLPENMLYCISTVQMKTVKTGNKRKQREGM